MRRTLATWLLALVTVALFNIALADDHRTKPAVDFNAIARLNGTTSSLGKTGVVVKILSAAIAKDGTITARATIVDSNGIALDRLGVATPGPVSLSFICAYIPAGKSQYVSYTTTVASATLNSNPSQTQAANDSGGTFTMNAIGDYTYTFKTKAPANFDPTVTHSVGVSAYRNLSAYGTFDEWSEVGNDVFSFVPNGSAVTTTRSVVTTNACNQCHDPLFAHGGSRVKVELCIMCHTPQTINPDTQLTQDMKVLIHKIHMGSSLPSVKAGTPYRIWHRGAWSDFSNVVFPQDIRNCTTCHAAPATQADNWKTNPSSAACGSCHDDVNFTTGANHINLPANDSQCKTCHSSVANQDFDASIPGAHVVPNKSTSLPGLVTKIISVTGTTPGSTPVVTFSMADAKGNAVDATKITSLRVVLAGGNVDYNTGNSAMRASENPLTNLTALKASSGGVFTYTMTNKIPATATGSMTISIEASNNVVLMPNTVVATTVANYAMPVEYYFSVDKSPVVARRTVVSMQKCQACHNDLSFVHGSTRANTQECVICHNPALSDGTSGQSVDFAVQIHSTHRGSDLANPYTLGTTNYQSVQFPGDLRDCTACHNTGTYLVENVGAKTAVASPGGFTKTTPPISAACQGCHDDVATASHALANTTALGESCNACHAAGMEFSVDRVHQRIF
ncbi:MAG TPA: OmcA/MtrC family decaheme c-type cytochrome [Verrucomicrobiae bacterium]|nr:OmcA/MtrC family decaheme c-type cytochrome [Verrucomicrobiae bacterium]